MNLRTTSFGDLIDTSSFTALTKVCEVDGCTTDTAKRTALHPEDARAR